MTHDEQRKWLIQKLLDEDIHYKSYQIPDNLQEQKDLLRSLMNVRLLSGNPGALTKKA